jgi:holliday junction DNA helicase RuvA
MITFLEGAIDDLQPTRLVMNVGGVGYEVAIPLSTYDRLSGRNPPGRVLTVHITREDGQALYGFVDAEERRLFQLLLTISGIGPKIALSALSGMTVREIKAAVAENDVKRLSSISGVGRKTAERMVIELRDKLSAGETMEAVSGGDEAADARLRDAVLALISLGYKQADAQKMIRQTMTAAPEAGVEELVRRSLTGR